MNDLLPTPVTDTAFEVANTLNQTTKDGLTAFVSSILEGFRLFWHHPTVTPQELAGVVMARYAAAGGTVTERLHLKFGSPFTERTRLIITA